MRRGEGAELLVCLRVTARAKPAWLERLKRAVAAQARACCGEACGALSSLKAGAELAAAERRGDLLVHLRVVGQGSPECADQLRGACEGRARVRVRGGRGAHLLVRVRVAGHASLECSEGQGSAGATRLRVRVRWGKVERLLVRLRVAKLATPSSRRLGQTVVGPTRVRCGDHCDAVSSLTAGVTALQADA